MYEELVKELRQKHRAYVLTDNAKPGQLFADAADAIEELQNNYDTVTSVQKHVIENQRNKIKNLRNDLDFAIRAEAAAIEACKPRWISVEDRLPEKKKAHYLCYLDDDSIGVCYWSESVSERGKWEWHNPNWKTVTHWMPLPAPPKGEQKNEKAIMC